MVQLSKDITDKRNKKIKEQLSPTKKSTIKKNPTSKTISQAPNFAKSKASICTKSKATSKK